jgi:hypothetical protein
VNPRRAGPHVSSDLTHGFKKCFKSEAAVSALVVNVPVAMIQNTTFASMAGQPPRLKIERSTPATLVAIVYNLLT